MILVAQPTIFVGLPMDFVARPTFFVGLPMNLAGIRTDFVGRAWVAVGEACFCGNLSIYK